MDVVEPPPVPKAAAKNLKESLSVTGGLDNGDS